LKQSHYICDLKLFAEGLNEALKSFRDPWGPLKFRGRPKAEASTCGGGLTRIANEKQCSVQVCLKHDFYRLFDGRLIH